MVTRITDFKRGEQVDDREKLIYQLEIKGPVQLLKGKSPIMWNRNAVSVQRGLSSSRDSPFSKKSPFEAILD